MPGNLVDLTPAVIATWPRPNYVNPSQKLWITPLIAVLYTLGTVITSLRLLARYRRHGGSLGLDDALIFVAWLLMTGFTVCGITGVEIYKSNRHMWDIPSDLWQGLALLTGIAEILYLLAGGCIRISVLLFYRRLVEDTCSRRWRYAVLGAIIFTASWVVACTAAITFSCTPIDAYWRSYNPHYTARYHCLNIAAVNYLVGTLTIVADIYAVMLPCIMTWNFTMPRSQKLGLNLIFGASLFVVAACCVRNYYLFRQCIILAIIVLQLTLWIGLSWDSDFSSILTDIDLLSQIELQGGVICASAPALRILYRLYIKDHLSKAFPARKNKPDSGSSGSADPIIGENQMCGKKCWGDLEAALASRWSIGDTDQDDQCRHLASAVQGNSSRDFQIANIDKDNLKTTITPNTRSLCQ